MLLLEKEGVSFSGLGYSYVRFLLAYVTNLERSAISGPIYKKYSLLFKVEKLIFATNQLVDIKAFGAAYDNK